MVCDMAVSSTARLTGPTIPFSILNLNWDFFAKVRIEYRSDPKFYLTAIGMIHGLGVSITRKKFDQTIGFNLTDSDIFHNQLANITIHSRHDEESSILEIPELTNDIKGKPVNPCFVVRSGQKHVFQFNGNFQNTTIPQLWIYTTSNGFFTNLIHLKLICCLTLRAVSRH